MSRYGDDPIDFGATEDDYRSYDLHGEETARGPLILALAAGVLIVFGAVVWNTYRQGVRTEPSGLPMIAADNSPYKRQIEPATTSASSDQELRFYDEMDGSTRQEHARADGLRRSVAADPEELLAGGGANDALPAPATGETEARLPELVAPRRSTADTDTSRIAVLDEATVALANEAEERRRIELPVARSRPGVIEPTYAFDPEGAYMVQIAALRDRDGAEGSWSTFSERYPEIFAGAEKRIQRADLGVRGTFYRVRVGAFSDRSTASAFCDAFKSTGNDCIIVQ